MPFFDDTAHVLRLSREHAIDGYSTVDYLQNVEDSMSLIKDDLDAKNTEYDHYLAGFVEKAINEVNMTRNAEFELHGHHEETQNQF